jgi:hypothetical protein
MRDYSSPLRGRCRISGGWDYRGLCIRDVASVGCSIYDDFSDVAVGSDGGDKGEEGRKGKIKRGSMAGALGDVQSA